jgi:TRAP-type C4-dicarboxylate transport system permease large subunit
MVIYGVMASVSVGHLFVAGMLPGVLLAIVLTAVPLIVCWRNPKLGPPAASVPWRERFSSLKYVWHVMLVMVAIIGTIFFGSPPTEAAGIAAVIIITVVTVFVRWKSHDCGQRHDVACYCSFFFSYLLASAGVGNAIGGLMSLCIYHRSWLL